MPGFLRKDRKRLIIISLDSHAPMLSVQITDTVLKLLQICVLHSLPELLSMP